MLLKFICRRMCPRLSAGQPEAVLDVPAGSAVLPQTPNAAAPAAPVQCSSFLAALATAWQASLLWLAGLGELCNDTGKADLQVTNA